jgi:hypothetical protein
MLWRTTKFYETYFFITAEKGGWGKWLFMLVSEMKQTNN